MSSLGLFLGLPNGLFPSNLPTNILYVFFISQATYSYHLILPYMITRTVCGDEYKLGSPHDSIFSILLLLPSS